MLNTLPLTTSETPAAGPSRAQRRHHGAPPAVPPVMARVLAALITSGIVGGTLIGATAPAMAYEQGGVDPGAPSDGFKQGGVDPGNPAPAPAPAPAPPAVPGPGVLPAPPQEAPYQTYTPNPTYTQPTDTGPTETTPSYTRPEYQNSYNSAPSGGFTLPKPTAPVRPIAPPTPKTLRVGNIIVSEKQLKRDAPWLTDRQRNSINAYAAYGEAKIAQGLISIGVPPDEASRQAAATIIGVAVGGTAGAAAAGIPAAVIGGVGGALIGTGVGAIVGSVPVPGPQTPAAIAAGAGIGGAAGAVVVGGAAAVVGGVVGGVAGGVIANVLGAGDPKANPSLPGDPNRRQHPRQPQGTAPAPEKSPAPAINRGNQFEFHLPADQAAKAGLPAVHYQVNVAGDVDAEATIGGRTVKATLPAAQAQAPYAALGAAGEQVRKTVTDVTRQATDQIQKALPGVQVTWPQETPRHRKPASAGGRHR